MLFEETGSEVAEQAKSMTQIIIGSWNFSVFTINYKCLVRLSPLGFRMWKR